MQDRPTVLELLDAVREFLENDVMASLTDPRLRYHLLIAVSVLRIVEREIPGEGERSGAELEALQALLGVPLEAPPADPGLLRQRVLEANQELCERIRRGMGDSGPWRERVLSYVRAQVEAKLRINNPAELPESGAEPPRDRQRGQ